MKQTLRLRLFGIAFAMAAITSVFGGDKMTAKLSTATGEEFDQRFLSNMIQHHRHGVEMAKLATERAQQRDIKRFAERTARAQQKDIDKMTGLLGQTTASAARDHTTGSAHAGTDHSATTTASGSEHSGASHAMSDEHDGTPQKMMAKLQSASGAEFDRVFVQQMLQHHLMGAEMARLAQTRGHRSDVKEFAEETAEEQQEEIAQLRSFQAAVAE